MAYQARQRRWAAGAGGNQSDLNNLSRFAAGALHVIARHSERTEESLFLTTEHRRGPVAQASACVVLIWALSWRKSTQAEACAT